MDYYYSLLETIYNCVQKNSYETTTQKDTYKYTMYVIP